MNANSTQFLSEVESSASSWHWQPGEDPATVSTSATSSAMGIAIIRRAGQKPPTSKARREGGGLLVTPDTPALHLARGWDKLAEF